MDPKEPSDPNEPDNLTGIYNLNTKRGRRAHAAANRRLRLKRSQENKAKQAQEQETKGPGKRAQNRDFWRQQPRCSSVTRTGKTCKRAATHPAFGAPPGSPPTKCYFHAKSEEEQEILKRQAEAVRKQSKLKPHELMRTVIESNPIAFMQPYLDSLGIRIVFLPDENDPSILHPTAVVDPTSKGATLFGVSNDGRVVVSKHKDIEAQQRAAERLFDRVYGRPKQTQIIASSADSQDPQVVPFDEKRQAEVAAILEAAKKPSHASLQPGPNSNN